MNVNICSTHHSYHYCEIVFVLVLTHIVLEGYECQYMFNPSFLSLLWNCICSCFNTYCFEGLWIYVQTSFLSLLWNLVLNYHSYHYCEIVFVLVLTSIVLEGYECQYMFKPSFLSVLWNCICSCFNTYCFWKAMNVNICSNHHSYHYCEIVFVLVLTHIVLEGYGCQYMFKPSFLSLLWNCICSCFNTYCFGRLWMSIYVQTIILITTVKLYLFLF